MTATIQNKMYLWAHGEQPRGRGRWIFSPVMCPNFHLDPFYETHRDMTYTEARALALKWAQANGYRTLYVQP